MNVHVVLHGTVKHLYHHGDILGFGNTRGTVIVFEGTPPPPDPPDPPGPGPEPDPHEPLVKDKFPWVLYASKFRKRGNKNG